MPAPRGPEKVGSALKEALSRVTFPALSVRGGSQMAVRLFEHLRRNLAGSPDADVRTINNSLAPEGFFFVVP
jgi:hypothetical protein